MQRSMGCIIGVLVCLAMANAAAASSDFRVALRPYRAQVTAYAEIHAAPAITLKVRHDGVLTDLAAVPGHSVHAGQMIARLGGAAYQQALRDARVQLQRARANRVASKAMLDTALARRRQHFGSNQEVYQAQVSLNDAEARVSASRTALNLLETRQTVTAPVDGVIVSVKSQAGQSVAAGDAVAVLQPGKELWLRCRLFGEAAQGIEAGNTAEFTPSDGHGDIPVTVTGRYPAQDAAGGSIIRLVMSGNATPGPHWYAGQSGTVSILLPAQSLPAVPNTALILDQGRWWVMVEGEQGPVPRRVEPEGRDGTWTWLRKGIAPGDRVLVENAYETYHRNFAASYQQPD